MTERRKALITGASRGIGRAICVNTGKSWVDIALGYNRKGTLSRPGVQRVQKGSEGRGFRRGLWPPDGGRLCRRVVDSRISGNDL